MELSKSQTLPTQETGVISAEKPYFGPVRHEYHDTKNWIVTTSKPTAKEILLNPEPQHRRRQPSTPAFLRPSPAGHRLPALVKILHSIPAAREALLCRECLETEYKHHSDWWDGVPIESPQVIQYDNHLDTLDKEIIHEVQRLIAFLDDTDRAYGSSEALSAVSDLRRYQDDSVVKESLDKWCDAAVSHASGATLSLIFHSRGERTYGEDYISEDTNLFELPVNEQQFEPGQTLYDTIDSFLWPHRDGSDPEYEVFLEKVADVFIIKVARGNNTAKSLDIKIPPVWYSDRYRKSSQPRIHQMLAAKAALRGEIVDLDARKQRASEFKSSTQPERPVDITRLLQIAQQHFQKDVDYQEEVEELVPTNTEQEAAKGKAYSRIAEELKLLSDRVARKLQGTLDNRLSKTEQTNVCR